MHKLSITDSFPPSSPPIFYNNWIAVPHEKKKVKSGKRKKIIKTLSPFETYPKRLLLCILTYMFLIVIYGHEYDALKGLGTLILESIRVSS